MKYILLINKTDESFCKKSVIYLRNLQLMDVFTFLKYSVYIQN